MHGIADFWAFCAAIVVFLALPGPGTFALLGATSKGGFRAGAAATLGLILGDQILLWLAVAGVAAVLAALPKGCLIVDLASKPGGTDFAAARRLGHTALHALSLPTVWAPETAGEALARSVQTILQEREGTI